MGFRKQLPPLSTVQTEIMNVIWEKGEATVSEVQKRLAARRELARNTVQTLLSRLERKGWLRHTEDRNTFLYTATVKKGATVQDMVARLVDTAFDGSAEGLIMALLDGRGISQDERTRIQELINSAKR